MKARLVNRGGFTDIDLPINVPIDRVVHEGVQYRLLGYEDPSGTSEIALYAQIGMDVAQAIRRATLLTA